MSTPHALYTAGYMTIGHPKLLADKAQALGAIIADIRFSPNSRSPEWKRENLEGLLKRCAISYMWVQYLGNKNYKGGPITLDNPEAGVRMIVSLLDKQPVILLCACSKVVTCHRYVAAKLIADECRAQVVHLGESDFRRPGRR